MKPRSGIDIQQIIDYKEFVQRLSEIKKIVLRDNTEIFIEKFLDHHSQKPIYRVNNTKAPQIKWHELKTYYLITDDLNVITINVETYGKSDFKRRYLDVTYMGSENNSFRIHPSRILHAIGIEYEESEENESYEEVS